MPQTEVCCCVAMSLSSCLFLFTSTSFFHLPLPRSILQQLPGDIPFAFFLRELPRSMILRQFLSGAELIALSTVNTQNRYTDKPRWRGTVVGQWLFTSSLPTQIWNLFLIQPQMGLNTAQQKVVLKVQKETKKSLNYHEKTFWYKTF